MTPREKELESQILKLQEERNTLRTTLKKAHDMVSRAGQPESHDFIACLFDGIYGLQEGLGRVVAERDALKDILRGFINADKEHDSYDGFTYACESLIKQARATLATGEDQ